MFDLEALSPTQAQMVTAPEYHHLLCVAGPGSGKTRVLTHRLGHLVMACGILPSRLRGVTFTRKAAQEMKDRLKSLDRSFGAVKLSTIHTLCRDVIGKTQGVTIESRDFQCYIEDNPAFKDKNPENAIFQALVRFLKSDSDTKDHRKRTYYKIADEFDFVIRTSLDDFAADLLAYTDKGDPKEHLQKYIEFRKMQAHCKEYLPDAKLPTFSLKYARYVLPPFSIVCEGVFEHYCEILKEWKILDFTDQSISAHLGLRKSEDSRFFLQSQWDVLAVDEFQDVDAVQFEVFRLLCEGDTKLNAVGDPDQAIFGFRGGDASFISDFKEYFPDAEIVKLNTNYRSHTEVIDVAYTAVERIKQPYRAKGQSANGTGGTVGFARTKEIGVYAETGTVGVLSWTNKTLTDIAKDLLWSGTLCVKDTRWGRYLNVPKPMYRTVYQTLQALGMVTGDIDFDRDLFLKYAQDMKNIGTTVTRIEGSTLDELRRSPKVARYITFLRNLRHLSIPDRVRSILNPEIFKFRQFVSPGERETLTTIDFSQTYDQRLKNVKVQLYTIHRAKGLEFDTVFVNTSDFEKPFVMDNPDESKRLLFVALSRARQNLFLLGGEDQGNPITAPVVKAVVGMPGLDSHEGIHPNYCDPEHQDGELKTEPRPVDIDGCEGINPHLRDCERDPDYNWREDDYYSEDNIRARLRADAKK